MDIIFASLLGLAAGFINALSTGGGLIAIPGLIFMGVPPVPAIATTRLSQLAAGVSASYEYQKSRNIAWSYMPYFAVMAVIAGAVGPHILLSIDQEYVEKSIAVLMLALLPVFLFRKEIGTVKRQTSGRAKAIGFVLAFLVLLYSTMFGAGTGILFMYVLTYCFGLKVIEANATCTVAALIGTVVALITFITNDMVLFHIGIPLMIGALVGGYFGARTAIRKGSAWVKWVLATVVIVSSIKLLS